MDKCLEIMRNNPSRVVETAYHNSSKNAIDTKNSNRKNNFLTNTLIPVAMSVVITVSIPFIGDQIEEGQISSDIETYFADNGYYSGLSAYLWTESTLSGIEYGYNHFQVAEWVKSCDNPDIALYSFYNKLDQNRIWNMDEVVSKMGKYGDEDSSYTSFSDYLLKKGFVDGDGNSSTKRYEEVMNDRVMAEVIIEQTALENGISRG